MQEATAPRFDELVFQYLEQPLPDGLATSVDMPALPAESQDFIVRMLALMKRSGFPATDFTPPLIHWLSVTVPGTLPGAWGGQIPPLTLPGRHTQLDALVAGWASDTPAGQPVFLDVGCGFPPFTSIDTASCLPDWEVFGVDRSFADHVLYDSDGHYACFDRAGTFMYFQALMNASGRALYADPQATRSRFKAAFSKLRPLLKETDGDTGESVELDGHRLVHHPIRDFEAANLTFIQSDFRELDLPPAAVMRCMNVLIYYTPDERKQMLQQIGDQLQDGGVLIAGTNGLGVQTRYALYRKGDDGLVMDEFAFGLDNVGHIVFMPFFSIHENDSEAMLLAELAGVLRKDPTFANDFGRRQDDLLQRHDICHRNPQGFLVFHHDGLSPADYLKVNALIWRQLAAEGFADRAVKVLLQAGYDARKNPVGDIAIRPF